MAAGFKSGGRVAGTPNKRSQEVKQRLDELGCDPIEGMAKLAMDDDTSNELRGQMYKELAQYIAPKRRAIEQEITMSREPTRQEAFNQLAAQVGAEKAQTLIDVMNGKLVIPQESVGSLPLVVNHYNDSRR